MAAVIGALAEAARTTGAGGMAAADTAAIGAADTAATGAADALETGAAAMAEVIMAAIITAVTEHAHPAG
jgi:hypothetical protein